MTIAMKQQPRPSGEPFSQRLSRWSHEFDLITNHLLGYVIAFTSLVAFADVLGGGQVLQYVPILYWLWVLAQGLGVEYQVLVLIKRMPGYWKSNKTMFGVYGVFILFLCLMSVVIGSVFTEHDQQHSSIEAAMNTLGISHIGFVYARSALAILLVALIAIDRAIEQQRDVARVQVHMDEQQSIQQVQQVFTTRIDELMVAQRELAMLHHQTSTLLPAMSGELRELQRQLPHVSQEFHTMLGEVVAQQGRFVQTTVTEMRTLSLALDELRMILPELVQQQLSMNLEQQVMPRFMEQVQALLPSPHGVHDEQDEHREVHREPHLELIRGTGSSGVNGSIVQQFIHAELEQGRTPTISDIMNATGCSKGSASRHRNEVIHHSQEGKERTRQA